ncbi:hypothetical protein NON00_11270 [Roseomonas sp. GC11]|uniref:hypothetical protein n=1 Tax=Roseomonas sp. GC11 TaxID=2950546 RepID=UPI00210F1A77|nr:hypothetical protein [Roseomonas sp. GC11]MCQ4160508.1 hypothetical protein [Roseomonas sp. GC11]
MATTISLTSASSNLASYLSSWSNAGYGSTYGAFYGPTVGLQTNTATIGANPSWQYSEWGNGVTSGGDGVVLESSSSFQYSGGNLTGDVDTLTFGTGYSQSSSGVGLSTAELTLGLDQSFNYNGSGLDAFDYTIYGISRLGTLSYLYNYLAATGTVIEDTTGSDVLVGFGGTDTFVFNGGDDTVTNAGPAGTSGYVDGTDTLDVSAWGVTDFASLEIFDDSGSAYVAYGNSSIELVGVDSAVLDASDFVFA